MHSSEFDDAATESLMIEGAAGEGNGTCSPRVATIPTSYGRRATGRRNDHPRVIRGHVLPAISSSEVAGRPTANRTAVRRNGMRRVPVPMDREISGHWIEQQQAQIHRREKETQ
jgi:hypothetical protein